MKRLFLLFTVAVLFLGNIHAQYQVNYVSSTNSTVTVRSVGYENKAKKALATAELSAFKAILFQGIDNAANQTALIPTTENEIRKLHKEYFDNLFSERYREFIASSTIVQPFSKDIAKRKNIVVDVTIKIRALREDLEKNGIIRKFGL